MTRPIGWAGTALVMGALVAVTWAAVFGLGFLVWQAVQFIGGP